jgi:hypothetical protein
MLQINANSKNLSQTDATGVRLAGQDGIPSAGWNSIGRMELHALPDGIPSAGWNYMLCLPPRQLVVSAGYDLS